MSREDDNVFNFSKRTFVFLISIVVIILFVIVIFIIPNISYIDGLIGISSPVVAKVNGQILTVNDLINYNCNRYVNYNPKCKSNVSYEGQLQNFINYTIEYQYLEKHNNLPTKSEMYNYIYKPLGITESLIEQDQYYREHYQKLVVDNISRLLQKNVTGTLVMVSYQYASLLNNLHKNIIANKKESVLLINRFIETLKNATGGAISSVSNYKFVSQKNYIFGLEGNYTNLNINNYSSQLMIANAGIPDNILNQNNGISKIYYYYDKSRSILTKSKVAFYYFVITNNVTGNYGNYNNMISNLRGQSSVVIY